MDAPPIVTPPPAFGGPPQPIARLTFPLYVRVLALVTAVAFVFALSRVPKAIRAGIDAERGHRDLAAARYVPAERELGRVLKTFPEAQDARIDYAEAAIKTGDLAEAGKSLEWFEGKNVTQEQSERLDAIGKEGDALYESFKKAQAVGK